jgi:hypothetical protein
MFEYVPACAGTPESWPVLDENVAQLGLFAIEKVGVRRV